MTRPYRTNKTKGKLEATIDRLKRLLASKLPRGAKGPLRTALAESKKALNTWKELGHGS